MLPLKLSIAGQILRGFCPSRTQASNLWGLTGLTMWFNLVYAVGSVVVIVLQLGGKIKSSPQGTIDFLLLIVSSAVNVISDVVLLVLPMYAAKNLQLSRGEKLGLLGAFAVGFM